MRGTAHRLHPACCLSSHGMLHAACVGLSADPSAGCRSAATTTSSSSTSWSCTRAMASMSRLKPTRSSKVRLGALCCLQPPHLHWLTVPGLDACAAVTMQTCSQDAGINLCLQLPSHQTRLHLSLAPAPLADLLPNCPETLGCSRPQQGQGG